MPVNVAVPTPPLKLTPDGSVPVIVMVGVGTPVAMILNAPVLVIVNVVLFKLVITGEEVGVTLTAAEAVALMPTELRDFALHE